MKEIGSEYEYGSFKVGKNEYIDLVDCPKRYVLSGRTGLYLVANEIKRKKIDSIALPSYCCFSMIKPFLDLNFKIEFYDKYFLPSTKAILIMDYFGFLSNDTITFAKKCSKNNKIIIVDATQTAFSRSIIYNYANYIIVSYRKWFDCLCSVVYSNSGFKSKEPSKKFDDFEKNWRKASKLKKQYLNNSSISKDTFLDLYALANTQLKENYKNYKASIEEIEKLKKIDTNYIRNRRRKNAEILIKGLKKYKILMFDKLGENDCPLFVPILLEKSKKDKIRDELIKNNVYCPCHWPIESKMFQKKTKYHDEELSLICDQRYNEKDMNRILKIIEKNL